MNVIEKRRKSRERQRRIKPLRLSRYNKNCKAGFLRVCKSCNKVKPLDEFYCAENFVGAMTECKECKISRSNRNR